MAGGAVQNALLRGISDIYIITHFHVYYKLSLKQAVHRRYTERNASSAGPNCRKALLTVRFLDPIVRVTL
jgi:hypothetical protein